MSITTAGYRVQSLEYDTHLSVRLCCQALDIHSGYRFYMVRLLASGYLLWRQLHSDSRSVDLEHGNVIAPDRNRLTGLIKGA